MPPKNTHIKKGQQGNDENDRDKKLGNAVVNALLLRQYAGCVMLPASQPADSRRHISPGTFLHKLAGQGKGDDDGGNPIIDMRFQPDAQPIIREESVEHTEQKSHRGGKRHQTVYIVAARPGSLPGTGIKMERRKTAVPELPVPSVFHGYRVHAQRL